MAPFEALYGRKCRTPVCWEEVGGRRLVSPELVHITSEKVKVVRDNLKIARDRQKIYVDNRRRDFQFEIGDQVFLKISPWKGVLSALYLFVCRILFPSIGITVSSIVILWESTGHLHREWSNFVDQ